MKSSDISKALNGLAKNVYLNHQEKQLLKDAAKRITDQSAEIEALRSTLDRVSQTELDMTDPFEEPVEAVAPGTAAEDFWDDGWPIE